MKKALITGIAGQDGRYLADFLLEKGYQVFGIENRKSEVNKKVKIISCDITNPQSVLNAISEISPEEIYHLAAQSSVANSFIEPNKTFEINLMGTLNILEAIKKVVPNCRFYFAASSEMFGKTEETPQSEKTRFHPRSPYGISKVAGYYLTQNYREQGLFAVSGILFNHESPKRGENFVTKKITKTLAKIKLGLANELTLGNLNIERDWGFAGDYVQAMWLMLQQDIPEDFVISTGETHSLKEFLEIAAGYLGLEWKKFVKIDKTFYRPCEIYTVRGDSNKAKQKLNWEPKTSFKELIKLMVDYDLEELKKTF